MHATAHTVDDVNQEIKDCERRLTTTSMNRQAEVKLIKEIEVLKKSIPLAVRFSEIDPKMKELKTQKNNAWAEMKEIRKKEDAINVEVEKIRKELEQTQAEKNDN